MDKQDIRQERWSPNEYFYLNCDLDHLVALGGLAAKGDWRHKNRAFACVVITKSPIQWSFCVIMITPKTDEGA